MNYDTAELKTQTNTNELPKIETSLMQNKSDDSSNGMLDKLGIWISSVCALHCLLLPLLLPIAPLVASSVFAEVWFERTILSFSILVGFAALFVGFHKYHRQLYPIYSLVLGGLIYWNKDIFGHHYEPFTIAVGALLIIAAHLINLRLCKQCKSCDGEACS